VIAFSRELLEEDERPAPVLIVAPRMIVEQADNQIANRDDFPSEDELHATHVARLQTELAMLQRALIRCGLLENATGSIKG